MSQHQQMIEESRVLLVRTGSHLYGTNTPESDEDFAGIFVPSEEYVFGLQRIEEVDLSQADKDESGRNTRDAVDVKYYELRKFAKLALENNPNVLELLFADDENVLFENSFGQLLRERRQQFLHRGLYKKFIGYAKSQRHKMQVRTENYSGLQVAAERLQEIYDEDPSTTLQKLYHKGVKCGITFTDTYAKAGDLNFMYHLKVGDALKKIRARIAKATNRSGLMDRYGFDLKFGMHLIRLLLEGRDLLKEGDLVFPLRDRELLLDIRNGYWTMEEVIKYSEDLEREIDALKDATPLPHSPQYHLVEGMIISIMRQHLVGMHATVNYK